MKLTEKDIYSSGLTNSLFESGEIESDSVIVRIVKTFCSSRSCVPKGKFHHLVSTVENHLAPNKCPNCNNPNHLPHESKRVKKFTNGKTVTIKPVRKIMSYLELTFWLFLIVSALVFINCAGGSMDIVCWMFIFWSIVIFFRVCRQNNKYERQIARMKHEKKF